ncbi:MAG TPA: hypothetical protein VFD92_15920 [Candidatus Binatia bacterium]|nr:hypothetical protein [Candidatus Binatia bacterium]
MDRDIELEIKEMFRKLYPSLSVEELERAQLNFDRYIALVVRIADHKESLIDARPSESVS